MKNVVKDYVYYYGIVLGLFHGYRGNEDGMSGVAYIKAGKYNEKEILNAVKDILVSNRDFIDSNFSREIPRTPQLKNGFVESHILRGVLNKNSPDVNLNDLGWLYKKAEGFQAGFLKGFTSINPNNTLINDFYRELNYSKPKETFITEKRKKSLFFSSDDV